MITYTERYGELWEMFIVKKFYSKCSSGTRALNKTQLIELANEFQAFLNRLSEGLGIAG